CVGKRFPRSSRRSSSTVPVRSVICSRLPLFSEGAAGRLALVLRRPVGRHIGLRLALVRFRFLIFLIAFLSLGHRDPPNSKPERIALVSRLFLGCAFTETESSEMADTICSHTSVLKQAGSKSRISNSAPR